MLLVRHISMEAFRVVKVIRKNVISSESFSNEVSILKNLRHPGVPLIYDIEEDDEFYYIIEEYIEGVSLDKYLQEYPKLSYKKKIRLITQICEIVNFMHTQYPNPIVHLDIKPQNIIVDYMHKQAYLLDYGNGYITNSGVTKKYIHGTIGYAKALQYDDVKSKVVLDMYSLAKVVYFIMENITDNRLVDMLDECINNNECMVRAEDLCSYFREEERDLFVSKKICVIGSKQGVGTTHFALALTTMLNRMKKSAVYVNYIETECIQSILEEKVIEVSDKGIIKIKGSSCCLLPSYDEENYLEDEECIKVIDMGMADANSISIYNDIIFLCGAREWEKEQTFSRYKELRPILDNRKVMMIFNSGTKMSVPYIRDPFNIKYMERKRFVKIIKRLKI